MTEDGGVVKWPPAVAVHLVNLSAVLQKEFTGCQGILVSKKKHVSTYMFVFKHTIAGILSLYLIYSQ